MLNLSNKRIIMIHGLDSKPPKETLHDLWRYSLIENIRIIDKSVAEALSENQEVFESAYWANAVPHHIPDDTQYCRKLKRQINKVLEERRKIKDKFHVGVKESVGAFFKDRGLDLAKLLTGALTVKDDVIKRLFKEIELYDQDQYIADRIRLPLEEALRRAWDDGCEPIILSHSMGTFIAYDVLWRFSHRQVQGFKEYRDKKVKILVTMGSPLGEAAIRDLLFSKYHTCISERSYFSNVSYWHNYACLGDVVAHQKNFSDLFYAPMQELNLIPANTKKSRRTIDYNDLHNPFEVVSHSGNKNKEKRNPHKSYGYLAQPRLGSWIVDYCRELLV